MESPADTKTQSNITSFGIKINTQQIRSIPVDEQESELLALGVNVYEQDDFEQSVIQQVDTYLQEKETEVAMRALEKELQDIREDLSNTEVELKCLETELEEYGDEKPEEYELRRRRDAILRQRDNKLNQYKKLQAREKYAIKRLSDKATLAKDPFGHKKAAEKRNESQALQEVSPAASVNASTSYKMNRPHSEDSFSWHDDIEIENEIVANSQHDLYQGQLYDSIKGKKRNVRRYGDDDSDNEFVPLEHEESSEEDEAALIEYERRKKPLLLKGKKKKKLSHYHKELKTALAKTKSPRAKTKVVDDGNDDAYISRVRLIKLKERLREKGEWDASYAESLSDDGLGDDVGNVAVTPSFKVPSRIWNRLYKYQKTGVKWLWELHCQQAGGIVGDEMGLGKTIQIIGLLAGLAVSKVGRYGSGRVGLGPVLIVCPATVLHQWVKEFHRWWPQFRVAILHETGSYSGKKTFLINKIVRGGGILVTSYSNMRIHQDELHGHSWDYIILDEGHKIRNPDAEITLAVKQFSTPHRVILSGSPMQNNLKELWSLFDFVFPGKLGTLPVFMAEFSVPITIGGYANATTVQVQTAYKCACILRNTINPYLLRRLKKDVKSNLQLPSKNEQVLFCRLTEEQVKLYKLYLDSREVSAILSNRMKVFPGLIMLRKICNHPDLTSTAGSLEWMKEKGRLKTTGDAKNPDQMEFDGGYGFWKRSGKLIVTEALLRLWKQQGHRVLLFSQTRQMLDILESFVKQQGYSYQRMDGSTSIASRQPAVDNFNKDTSIFVYLLTTRVGGLGLNLIGADRIIIFDPDWNPSTDMQARERSWRIGQDKHVTIYRLLTTGTIEEKIYHRQIFKQFLANRVLTNPMQRRFFKSNDLFELFTLGDERPNHGTETSAIFAGTGSEVKIPRKQDSHRSKIKVKEQSFETKLQKKKQKRKTNDSLPSTSATSDAWSISARDINDCSKTIKADPENDLHKDSQLAIKQSPQVPHDSGNNVTSTSKTVCLDSDTKMDEIPLDAIQTKAEPSDDDKHDVNELRPFTKVESRVQSTVETHSSAQGLSFTSSTEKDRPKAVRKNKKTKKKKRDAKVDGVRIQNLDKRHLYKRHQESSDEECPDMKSKRSKNHDEDVLASLFRSSGVHSALRHDTIEDPNNPDFVLVEKEAEKVAKQAANALRRSRNECRQAVTGIPTWTGNQGSAGRPGAKLRFGRKKPLAKPVSQVEEGQLNTEKTSDSDSDGLSGAVFTGSGLLGKMREENSHGLSSSSLLSNMRKRNIHSDGATLYSTPTCSTSTVEKTEDDKLLQDIRDFVAYRSKIFGQASTKEILDEFQSRIHQTKSALFRELLKQVCYLQKVDGAGIWFLKEEYR